MARGDNLYLGDLSRALIPQPDDTFSENETGAFDTGTRVFWCHPSLPKRLWPRRGWADSTHPNMFVETVRDQMLDCRMVELTVTYKGLLAASKPSRIIPGCDVQMFTLPVLNETQSATIVVPVPMPTLARSYVTRTQPTYAGVAQAVSADFLPEPPEFVISFVPDPNSPLTLNYRTGWVLQARQWEELGINVWLVRELFVYYYSLAV